MLVTTAKAIGETVTTVYFGSGHDDERRRRELYSGSIYVFAPTATTLAYCEFARSMIAEAFRGLDPETAQYEIPIEEYAQLLIELKPRFIHHPESKAFVQSILSERGCDPQRTFFEVPKLRSATSDGYLTAGIAYAWHPHRDTWYSAPQAQINWWMPIYEIESGNCMAFHPRYFDLPVANTSSGYNYYLWNEQHRGPHLTQYINEDPRPLPRPTEPVELQPDIRVVCSVGGLIAFSGAHLHSSVPNGTGRTRFSIDFRSVNSDDLVTGRGAPNVDSECTGTVLGEFRRVDDLSPIDAVIIRRFQDGTEGLGRATYRSA